MTNPDRIIVVGAGPVGLVCAMLLSEAGIDVLVVERGEDVSDDLRASTFHPPTLDMLAPYGITAQLIDNGLIAPTWQVRMLETGDYALFDLSLLADETGHPYRVQCEQRNLVRYLAEKVKAADVTFVFNAELTGLAQDADGVVATVNCDGEDVTFSGRYLIGADGANSAVREAIAMPFEGEMYPEATVLATTSFPFEDHLADLSYVNYCWTPRGSFARCCGYRACGAATSTMIRLIVWRRPCRKPMFRPNSAISYRSMARSMSSTGGPIASTNASPVTIAAAACCWPATPPTSIIQPAAWV